LPKLWINVAVSTSLRLLLIPLVGVLALSSAAIARPTGPGTIRGRVVDGSTGRPVDGIEVDLVGALPRRDGRFSLSSTTGSDGRYRFERLPTGDGRVYALSVEHKGGVFAGRPVVELGQSSGRAVVDSQLRVWDTISDPDAVLVQRHNLFVSQTEGGLGVIESLTIVNTSDSAYIGRARNFGRQSGGTTFAFDLPQNARDGRMLPDSDFFGTPIAGTDSGFGLAVAIPPGEWRVMFAYTLAGSAGAYDLSHTALYPTLNTALHVSDGLAVDSNRLADAGEITIGERRYVRWSSDDVVEAGEPIQVAVTAEAGTSPWLVAGLAGAGLLAAALFTWTMLRNRKSSGLHPGPRAAPASRERLVAAVAELDLRHDAGEIEDDEWKIRRAELKGALGRARAGNSDGGKSTEELAR
jgi:Carboxypeptidase regulatory-like domain